MPVYRTMREKFTDQRLTGRLLESMARTGPGSLIIANPDQGEYRLTHARWLRPTTRETVVYGYGDLLHELDWARLLPHEQAWPALVAAADRIAHACLEWEPWEPTFPTHRTALEELRHTMRAHGFALLRRPLYNDSGELRRLDDTYLDTTHPHITATVATPYPDAGEEEASTFTWITHQGAFVAGWHTPARAHHLLPEVIRDRIRAHLNHRT